METQKLTTGIIRIWQIFLVLILLLLAGSILFAAIASYNGVVVRASTTDRSSSRDKNTSQPSPTPTPEVLHKLVGSYYLTNENIDAKLLLNNKGNEPLEVRPTLYNKDGVEFTPVPVTVAPQSFQLISLNEWAALAGDSFKAGNIRLLHFGKDLVLGAQIYLTDHARSLSYEEKLAELGKFDSRVQEAVWWMPSREAEVRVVLTNTSDEPLSLVGRLGRKPNVVSEAHFLNLQPHTTRAIDLPNDFPGSTSFLNSEVISLSVEHSGPSDALLARALVYERAKGYSNAVQFTNPTKGRSTEYQGVGFQIEDILGSPMRPVIVARNVGPTAATVSVRVPYTRIDGTRGNILLTPEQLAPGEMRLLNVQRIIQRSHQEQIDVASLEVTYDTAPGSVIVNAHSVSNDHDQVFRVPMWDPMAQRSPTGGYPWRLEGTSITQTYIKNVTDTEEDYVAFLVWQDGGMYMLGRKSIAPHETVNIDVERLRDEQVPDENGQTIPLNITSGQLQWTLLRKDTFPDDDTRANLSLLGRSEQVDIENGIATNYSCQNCCVGDHVGGYVSPSTIEIEYGQSASFQAYEMAETCYGFPYVYPTGASWTSSNAGMGQVSGGSITPQAAGQTNISASWQTQNSFVEPCPPGGGGPMFAWYSMAEACTETRTGGPRIDEDEFTETGSNTALLIPECGVCQTHMFTTSPPAATLTVKPKVRITGPGSANDGSNVTFSATVEGGTPSSYNWTAEWSSGAGNNPKVTFGSSTAASTSADAHWFANPNSACSASRNSKYEVKLAVTVNGQSADKEQDYTVMVPWDPAGVTTATPTITGGPIISFDPAAGVWRVTDIGTLAYVSNVSKTITVPTASQFYAKTDEHESKHVQQWDVAGLRGQYYNPATFYARIRNFTAPTSQALIQMLEAELSTFLREAKRSADRKCNQAEIEAFGVSDPLNPQYIYQICGRTTFPNC